MEAKANLMQPSVNSFNGLGNSVYLNLDALPESTSVYNNLVSSYRWFDKTREYASGAATLVSQNSLSRSYGKRRGQRRPQNNSHLAPPK